MITCTLLTLYPQSAEEDARRRCSCAWRPSRQEGLGLLQALCGREGAQNCRPEGRRQEAEGTAEVRIGEGKNHWQIMISNACVTVFQVGSKAPKKIAKKTVKKANKVKAPAKKASTAKKSATKKASLAKKPAAKKSAAKKPAAKKPSTKKMGAKPMSAVKGKSAK